MVLRPERNVRLDLPGKPGQDQPRRDGKRASAGRGGAGGGGRTDEPDGEVAGIREGEVMDGDE